MNWNDAKAYVAWLAKKTSKNYRLLSEAEWEYAARAGTTTRYFFGDEEKEFCRYGNGFDHTAKSKVTGLEYQSSVPCSDGYPYTSPVGNFLPNGFGLYDMLGNATQWVEDCFPSSYREAPLDGSAWKTGQCIRREQRGGSWANEPRVLRAAARFGGRPEDRDFYTGFRVARTL